MSAYAYSTRIEQAAGGLEALAAIKRDVQVDPDLMPDERIMLLARIERAQDGVAAKSVPSL